MLPQTVGCEMEFVGGPVDGYVGFFPLQPRAFLLVRVANPPKRRRFIASVMGMFRRDTPEPDRVAIYERCERDDRLVYEYLQTQPMPATPAPVMFHWSAG